MKKLIESVGLGAVNNESDVRLVQQLLNGCNITGVAAPLLVDGNIGEHTISRIKAFQKQFLGMQNADGRVDPDGITFSALVTEGRVLSDPGSLDLSDKGITLLSSIESLATQPYDDQTGKTISAWVVGATIGYGHLISESEWERYKDGITESQALDLFRNDLQGYVKTVQEGVTGVISQNEFDALVILTFNIGEQAFLNSSVLMLVNDPEASTPYDNLEQAWKAWDKSQGKVNGGLQNRRQAEWNIYSKNIYEKW
jgi:lysozyme